MHKRLVCLQLWFQPRMSDCVLLDGVSGGGSASGKCGPGFGLAVCMMGVCLALCVCLAKYLSGCVCVCCVCLALCVECERDGGGVPGGVCVFWAFVFV